MTVGWPCVCAEKKNREEIVQNHSALKGILMMLASVIALAMLASGHASAGDRAQTAIVGFSPDGAYVAFEEFGSQDGSGFPYSNIYVLDVAANDWVSGSPIRVMIEDDEMSEDQLFTIGLHAARQRAMQQAASVFAARGIVPGNVGTTVIHHPYSDLEAPAYRVPFSIGAAISPYLAEHNELRLSLRPTASETCASYGLDQVFIFSLELIQDGLVTALQSDSGLPESRVCPTDYRIHQIVVYGIDQPDQTLCCAERYAMLVLVAMQRGPGFEGPDTRYLGVSGVVPFNY